MAPTRKKGRGRNANTPVISESDVPEIDAVVAPVAEPECTPETPITQEAAETLSEPMEETEQNAPAIHTEIEPTVPEIKPTIAQSETASCTESHENGTISKSIDESQKQADDNIDDVEVVDEVENSVPQEVEEFFAFTCELCEFGYNGTFKEHLDCLFDHLTGEERRKKYYEAMQKHWKDFNMRNNAPQPICSVCSIHFQGFMKLGIHMREKANVEEDTPEKEGHAKLLSVFREFIHGIKDDAVSHDEQRDRLQQLICPHCQFRPEKLQLKATTQIEVEEAAAVEKAVVEKVETSEEEKVEKAVVEKAETSEEEKVEKAVVEKVEKTEEESKSEENGEKSVEEVDAASQLMPPPDGDKAESASSAPVSEDAATASAASATPKNEKAEARKKKKMNQEDLQMKPLFRCNLCHRDFRYLRHHIKDALWSNVSEKESWTNGHVHHLRGLLGQHFNDLVRVDTAHRTAYCPICGIHHRMTKGFAKGVFFHLRSFGYGKDAANAEEKEKHQAKCEEITNKVMSYLEEKCNVEALHTYFATEFFCPVGGVDLDLGSCMDSTREDTLRDRGEDGSGRWNQPKYTTPPPPGMKRKGDRNSGNFGGGGGGGIKIPKFGGMGSPPNRQMGFGQMPGSSGMGFGFGGGGGGGGGLMSSSAASTECSLCNTSFRGRNPMEADQALHAHLLETLFAARVGRGGHGFPTHRYWHQLAPNSRPVNCPLCSIRCENLDGLALHLATVMSGSGPRHVRDRHYELASTIAEKFVAHMNGYFSLEDMGRFFETVVRNGGGGFGGGGGGGFGGGGGGGHFGGGRGGRRGGRGGGGRR